MPSRSETRADQALKVGALLFLLLPVAASAAGTTATPTPPPTSAKTSATSTTTRPRSTTHARKTTRPVTTTVKVDSAATRAATVPTGPMPESKSPEPESAEVLHGGQDGTVFRTLTIEGEDRVHVEFDRPALDLNMKAEQAPGLEVGSPREVLDRTTPDLMGPMVNLSARDRSPFTGHPWLTSLATGAVARFRPEVKDVVRWKLTVANSKGEAVTSFAGKGDPPREIVWDGRTTNGTPVIPGLTYSYVFEAWDKAGNRRNFVGKGFEISAYRQHGPEGSTFVFSGRDMTIPTAGRTMNAPTSPMVMEVASWLNQSPPASRIQVTATARTFEQANALSSTVSRQLAALALGDPQHIQPLNQVEPDAPEGGTVKVAAKP
jgi:hypothetical protein